MTHNLLTFQVTSVIGWITRFIILPKLPFELLLQTKHSRRRQCWVTMKNPPTKETQQDHHYCTNAIKPLWACNTLPTSIVLIQPVWRSSSQFSINIFTCQRWFSDGYFAQRKEIRSHLPDTLVLNHPVYFKRNWPQPWAITCLLVKFYNIVWTTEPSHNRLLDHPPSVEVHFVEKVSTRQVNKCCSSLHITYFLWLPLILHPMDWYQSPYWCLCAPFVWYNLPTKHTPWFRI